MAEVPCIVFALALHDGAAHSVIPAVQNMMLAARAIGIGSVPTTLHPSVMDRFHRMFDIPDDVGFHFCVPLGYAAGQLRPERSQANLGDDLPRLVGRSGSLELTIAANRPRCPSGAALTCPIPPAGGRRPTDRGPQPR